ncbi:cytochrome P450 [Gordonia jinghuaiqii]|uniref:Cytochrome P450 n=1 Tax=Gordonia jinghuaiqii TaxID=2758710 RepID=A0A7D7LYR7_9ACTN|nr:cytochrome P450 [Gordonia jinghuaiqii]QMT03555.1 cytochrome P450 [Gordonia jinghuaiqii]
MTTTTTTTAAIPPEAGFDELVALDPEARKCPFPTYQTLQEEHPIAWSDALNAWVVTRYDDVLTILRQPEIFSSRQQSGPASVTSLAGRVVADDSYPQATRDQAARRLRLSQSPVLVNSDPPEHRRQRRLVTAAFSPRSIETMAPAITEIAESIADSAVAKGRVDLVQDFTFPFPMTVIARILGVPESKMEVFKQWTIAFTQGVGAHDLDRTEIIDLFEAVDDFYDYFTEQIGDREREPKDDLLTSVVQSRVDGERPLTEDELLQMLVQFLVAGNETTTNLIGSCLLKLTGTPELLAELKADSSRIPDFVEEILRLEAPTQGMYRTLTEDHNLAGTDLPVGSMVYMIYAAANRDPGVFACPHEISERNDRNRHLSFGRGEHLCLGMHLARREAIIALETLLSRVERIAPVGELTEVGYNRSFILRGIASLPVELVPAH